MPVQFEAPEDVSDGGLISSTGCNNLPYSVSEDAHMDISLSPLVAASCVSGQSSCQDTGIPLIVVALITIALGVLVIWLNHVGNE